MFPQVRGLGRTATAHTYGITGLDEARAYLAHPVLGPRLVACAQALLAHRDRTAVDIFGATDAMKLRSSMTLFARAAPDIPLFAQVLGRYFDASFDKLTDQLLTRR